MYEELDDPSMMVTPTQLANQLLDWTDPRRAVYVIACLPATGMVLTEGLLIFTDQLKASWLIIAYKLSLRKIP